MQEDLENFDKAGDKGKVTPAIAKNSKIGKRKRPVSSVQSLARSVMEKKHVKRTVFSTKRIEISPSKG